MSIIHKKNVDFTTEYRVSLELIEEEVVKGFSLAGNASEFLSLWEKEFPVQQWAASKEWAQTALGIAQGIFAPELKGIYQKLVSELKTGLKQGEPLKQLVQDKQAQLKKEVDLNLKEQVILEWLKQFNTRLGSETQLKEAEQGQLKEFFSNYFDKRLQVAAESLEEFTLIPKYTARLQFHNEGLDRSKRRNDPHMRVGPIDLNESLGEKFIHDYAFKLDIEGLEKLGKHAIASLKRGERILFEVEIPWDRTDTLKKIGETGFQYRIPLVALLLMIFIGCKMIKKEDETRVAKAVNRLIQKQGLLIDPREVLFSLKARGNDGKMQTLIKPRTLSPALIGDLLSRYQIQREALFQPKRLQGLGEKDLEEKLEGADKEIQTELNPMLEQAVGSAVDSLRTLRPHS